MYYSDYKKKNGSARKSNKNRNFQTEHNNSYYNQGRNYWPEDRFRWENPNNNYSNRGRYNEDEGYENYRSQRDSSYSQGDNHDDRNFFERAGDRIKEGWNNMTRHDDHDNEYLKSRHNRRQAGYDNGDYRNRPSQDEEYGYHHQRASHGYAGDNRTYNDNDYDKRYDEYERRYDVESNRYQTNSNNDDYYTGYREFERSDDRHRDGRWRGRYAW